MRFSEIGEISLNRAILGVLHILSKIHCKLNGKYVKSMSRHGLHDHDTILHISLILGWQGRYTVLGLFTGRASVDARSS